MKTMTTFTPLASFAAPSHPSRLASFWRSASEQALATAVLAVMAVVIFFMAIGVAAFVLELSQALTMAGPLGLAALALMAAAWSYSGSRSMQHSAPSL